MDSRRRIVRFSCGTDFLNQNRHANLSLKQEILFGLNPAFGNPHQSQVQLAKPILFLKALASLTKLCTSAAGEIKNVTGLVEFIQIRQQCIPGKYHKSIELHFGRLIQINPDVVS